MAFPSPATPSKIELEHGLKVARINATVTLGTTIIKYAALVACFGFIYLMTESLAGRTTLATIGLRIMGNLRVSDGISFVFGGGGVLYGVGQRQLRRRSVERLSKMKNELEQVIDQGRSSSGLTSTGTTRPEDEE